MKNLIRQILKEGDLDWVMNVDPISFIKNAFKEGDMEYGMLVNGSYSVSVGIPEETEYTWDEEKMIEKELKERIGVFCYFGLARGSEDEHLMAIDVDTEKDLKKVLKWIKSSDKRIKENEDLGWVDSLAKEKPSAQSLIGYLNSFLVDTYYRFSIVDPGFVHILGPSSVSDKNGDTEYLDMWVETFNLKSVEKQLKNIIKVFKNESDNDDDAELDFRNCVLILNKLEPAFKTKKKDKPIKENLEFGSDNVLLQGHKGYNPYKNSTFVRVDNGEPIFNVKEAILKNEKEVYVKL